MALGLSDSSPCGDSLDYDPAFADLEITARGKPEQHFGATLVPAQEPDWRQVQAKAVALFDRTRDLRVAVLLTRAQTVLEGLPALTASLELIRQLLVRHWDNVHPQLDPDDEHDPILRMNALATLADPTALLRDLRDVSFVQSAAAGTCSIRDAELAIGTVRQPDDQAPPITRAQLTALVRAHAAAGGKNEAQRAFETASALKSVVVEKAGVHQAVDLDPLIQKFRALAAFHAETIGEPAPAGSGQDASGGASGQGYSAAAGAATSDAGAAGGTRAAGEIRSREDAVRELDRVCAYLERHEPANPAPLLIRRAQRLVQMSFLDILRDLAPEGMSSIEKIAGLPPTE
jgi:type VI secretion system protein ImpA